MAIEVLQKTGTPVVFGAAAEYGDVPYDAGANLVEFDIGGLADDGAWQSAKADLGATRAAQYAVRIGIELDVDLSVAGTIEVYWSSSPSGTAGTGNTGGASGANEAYTAGVNSHLEHLQMIGNMNLPATCDADICYQSQLWIFTPAERYGSIVLVNKSGQALEATADTMYVALIPIVDEIQNA